MTGDRLRSFESHVGEWVCACADSALLGDVLPAWVFMTIRISLRLFNV